MVVQVQSLLQQRLIIAATRQSGSVTTNVRARITSCFGRRSLTADAKSGSGSTSNPMDRVGVIGPRRREPVRPKSPGSVSGPGSAANRSHSEPDVAEIPIATTVANIALGTALMAFCIGVGLYSMNKVGQASNSGSGDPDDPLAQLKREAAYAQESRQQKERTTSEATEVLQQFQSGEYDPDKYEDDLGNEERKPWWKFW